MFKGKKITLSLEVEASVYSVEGAAFVVDGVTLPCLPAHQTNLAAGFLVAVTREWAKGRTLVLGVLQVELPEDSWFP